MGRWHHLRREHADLLRLAGLRLRRDEAAQRGVAGRGGGRGRDRAAGLGGTLASAPTVSKRPGTAIQDVFYLNGSNEVIHNTLTNGVLGTSENLGGTAKAGSTVAAVSGSANEIDIFVRRADDSLWHRYYSGGGWSSWAQRAPAGHATSSPSVASWGANRLDLFVRGASNDLQHKAFDTLVCGGWCSLGWESLGGSLTTAPAAVSWGPNRIDIFTGGAGNALHQKAYNAGWSSWYNLGGSITSDPTVVLEGRRPARHLRPQRQQRPVLPALLLGLRLEQLARPRLALLGQRLRTGLELLRDRQQGGLLPRHRQRPLAASVLTAPSNSTSSTGGPTTSAWWDHPSCVDARGRAQLPSLTVRPPTQCTRGDLGPYPGNASEVFTGRTLGTPVRIADVNPHTVREQHMSSPAPSPTATRVDSTLPAPGQLLTRRRRRVLVTGAMTALLSAPLAFLPVPANAADPGGLVHWGWSTCASYPSSVTSGVVQLVGGGPTSQYTNIGRLALKYDGSVIAWSHSGYGVIQSESIPAAASTGVVDIDNSQAGFAMLKGDGSVVDGRAVTQVAAGSGITEFELAKYIGIGLKNGGVVAWHTLWDDEYASVGVPPGGDTHGILSVPGSVSSPGSGVTAVGAGNTAAYAVKNGAVIAWGNNTYGQTTVPASASSGVVSVSASGSHVLALKNDGSVVAWGPTATARAPFPRLRAPA